MIADSEVAWHECRRPLDDDTDLVMRFTTRAAGDFHIDAEAAALHRRRRSLVDRPWVWLRQVHGADVVTLDPDDTDLARHNGTRADALVSRSPTAAISVTVADCAPVVLWGRRGTVAVAHAGWNGTLAGVIDATVDALERSGETDIHAVVGPCIGPAAYEFGSADLTRMSDEFGDQVRARTSWGTPALDLRAAVEAAVVRSGAMLDHHVDGDTADVGWFSHRVRGDGERLAAVAWKQPR